MKRVLAILLAAATVAGPLAAGGAALAKDGDRGRWEQRGDRGGDRGGPDRGGPDRGGGRWQSRGEREGPRAWRGDEAPRPGRGPARRQEREDGRNYYGPPPGEYAPPPAYGLRRGGFLPPEAHGAEIEDPGRYRLRPPPRGFRWVRVGGAYALVGPNGQIFDMIR